MTDSIAIIVPVLGRPHRVRPLIENIRQTTTVPHKIVFVASAGDDEEIKEIQSADQTCIILPDRSEIGDYARKINIGYRQTTDPYIFTGADDLKFHRGWDRTALRYFQPGVGVVGTNDLGNPRVRRGQHATHSLVARWYADEFGTVDGPGSIYCELYPHEFCDDEMVGTAKARAAWAFAKESYVEHLHPHWKKAPMDALYAEAPIRLEAGREVYNRRMHKWKKLPGKAPISVIIGTFGDRYWKKLASVRAEASVRQQTLEPTEVILVHGSNLADARNEGAKKATNQWLCFLDADDELDVEFMQHMVVGSRRGRNLLNPAVQYVLPDGITKPARILARRNMRQGNYLVIGTVIQSDIFWRAGGFDPQWEAWEDWALWMRVCSMGGRVLPVPRAVYRAYMSEDGRNSQVMDPEGLRRRILADFDRWKGKRR